MPRISAISGVTFAPGSIPPSPGLAPWESLISIALTGAPATGGASAVLVDGVVEGQEGAVALTSRMPGQRHSSPFGTTDCGPESMALDTPFPGRL